MPGAADLRPTGNARSAVPTRFERRSSAQKERPRNWAGRFRRLPSGSRSAETGSRPCPTPRGSWWPPLAPSRPPQAGYAGAVLLDTPLLLLRQDLRAAEEALRRWLNVVALVRSGADGGSVIAVGESSGRALQALVRVDPGGFAARELAERAAARFPPAVKLITIEGPAEALGEFVSLVQRSSSLHNLWALRTWSCGGQQLTTHQNPLMQRLILRAPLAEGSAPGRCCEGGRCGAECAEERGSAPDQGGSGRTELTE